MHPVPGKRFGSSEPWRPRGSMPKTGSADKIPRGGEKCSFARFSTLSLGTSFGKDNRDVLSRTEGQWIASRGGCAILRTPQEAVSGSALKPGARQRRLCVPLPWTDLFRKRMRTRPLNGVWPPGRCPFP